MLRCGKLQPVLSMRHFKIQEEIYYDYIRDEKRNHRNLWKNTGRYRSVSYTHLVHPRGKGIFSEIIQAQKSAEGNAAHTAH